MNRLTHFISRESQWLGLLILILGHTLAALYSFGFHHPDEHYQILEFANAYLGLTPTSQLPWEYAAHIRPWFQPFLHVLLMKAAMLSGMYEPFSFTFITRMVYAGFNIWALHSLWRAFQKRFGIADPWWLVISLIWFYPYLHVRTSSENLAGIFLSFAFVQLWKGRERYAQAGLLFGFAFLARYQIALGLVGLGLALLLMSKKILREHLMLLLGFIVPVGLGVLLDREGYGSWVLTPYRYFTVNLVEGVAAAYNPYPWYQYFIWIVQLNPFVSLPLFFGTLIFTIRARTAEARSLSFFIWAFFLLHILIENKEYRFWFPILNLIPFAAAVGWSTFKSDVNRRAFWIPYLVVSLPAFAVSSLRGASIHTLGGVSLAHPHLMDGRFMISNHDYSQNSRYYSFPEHPHQIIKDPTELALALKSHPDALVIIDGNGPDPLTAEFISTTQALGCRMTDNVYPLFLYSRSPLPVFIKRLHFVGVFDCKQ